MEFERAVFRVHQRFLYRPCTKPCLIIAQFLLLLLIIFGIVNLYFMHSYVNNNQILKY